jgi:bacterioferritin-associated ferredoxin
LEFGSIFPQDTALRQPHFGFMILTIIRNYATMRPLEGSVVMIVCLCNCYRDSEIRGLAQRGHSCARQAYAALGQGPNCGRCLEMAQSIIDEVRRAPTAMAVPAE